MVKHVSARFAWHDNQWNGTICKSPKDNVYCIGNYSLLSPRIQRRIRKEIEESFKGHKISDVIKKEKYLPPCYWCINAQGKEPLPIKDPHPFGETRSWGPRFTKEVAPLKDQLHSFSIFTWCFKLSFERKDASQIYPPPEELDERVAEYINELKNNKSIVFFYANYSNPITGDYYEYLLLGAGLLRDVKNPKEYDIPTHLLDDIRSQRRMQNFPTLVWQFQIMLDPDSVLILPYHEYLDWVNKENGIEVREKWEKLEEVAVPIEESNLIPHFKYVSMHLPHDKSIYLLYLMKGSIQKMREHRLVNYKKLNALETKLENLLKIAWKEKGQYPGFNNALHVILSNDFSQDRLKSLIPKIESYIKKNFGSLSDFWKKVSLKKSALKASSEIMRAIGIIEKNKEVLKFLSLFDFSIVQFERVLEIINQEGFLEIKNNPYLLLEKYQYNTIDEITIDESDYGVSLYQIDIALIPDPAYADWPAAYNARSPERIRAVISKVLYDAAFKEGSSCLSRDEILKNIEAYPLYYINKKLKMDINKLLEYEKQPIFKEKFLIKQTILSPEAVYQLRVIREIENVIEQFISLMLKRKYELVEKDVKDIKKIVETEFSQLKEKLDVAERRKLYQNALSNGVFLLSGKAGSGKTSAIINLIRKFREDKEIPIFVFTPTGKANLVIRNRLKNFGLHKDKHIRVSTIHRFLYTVLFDYIRFVGSRVRSKIFELSHLIQEILSGKLERFDKFRFSASMFRLRPRVVIIDEASMVDEVLLATLFCLIDSNALKHLIIVGDEKQLPPIGVGRPFVDTIFHFKRQNFDANFVRLESNLRFDPYARLGILSEIFSGEKPPFPIEIESALSEADETLEQYYFKDEEELKNVIKNVLYEIGEFKVDKPIPDIFGDVFEKGGTLNLDTIQIICPRRVGSFGSKTINIKVIRDSNADFSPRTKLICEKNIYINARDKGRQKRILGLANGSIGYIGPDWEIFFEDIEDLKADYDWIDLNRIENEITGDFAVLKTERDIDFGYAITVHKAQGSDFEYVMFIIPEISPFIMRELLYTAFTRPRKKLYFLINQRLAEELPLMLSKAYENSSVEQRKTLLFGFKTSPFRPHLLTLKDGKTIEVRSKIELIIAKVLDQNEIKFEYEPMKFFEEYRIIPDFEVFIDGRTYYIEHLGNMKNPSYKNRWLQKFEIYKEKLQISEILVTTSESEEVSDIERNIKQIIEDMKANSLKQTEGGYSDHHYFI